MKTRYMMTLVDFRNAREVRSLENAIELQLPTRSELAQLGPGDGVILITYRGDIKFVQFNGVDIERRDGDVFYGCAAAGWGVTFHDYNIILGFRPKPRNNQFADLYKRKREGEARQATKK